MQIVANLETLGRVELMMTRPAEVVAQTASAIIPN
jgi:hypothetical protein